MSRFTNLREIERLDPERDCQRILHLSFGYEFAWDSTRALEVALYRTYCVPSISRLLDRTGEFYAHTQRGGALQHLCTAGRRDAGDVRVPAALAVFTRDDGGGVAAARDAGAVVAGAAQAELLHRAQESDLDQRVSDWGVGAAEDDRGAEP